MVESRIDRPSMAKVSSTPGMFLPISPICRRTSSLRWSDAPSGSCANTMVTLIHGRNKTPRHLLEHKPGQSKKSGIHYYHQPADSKQPAYYRSITADSQI